MASLFFAAEEGLIYISVDDEIRGQLLEGEPLEDDKDEGKDRDEDEDEDD